MEDMNYIYDWTPLIRISDGDYPRYMPQVRETNNQSSFPVPVRAHLVIPFDHMPVYNTDPPKVTTGLQYARESSPQKSPEDGRWYKSWTVENYTVEELETNLANEKNTLLSSAKMILNTDLSGGIDYIFRGSDYRIDVGWEKTALLVSMGTLAKDPLGPDTFIFSFMCGETVSITAGEYSTMWLHISNSIYAINKAFWEYCDDVNSKTSVLELPPVPSTFKV